LIKIKWGLGRVPKFSSSWAGNVGVMKGRASTLRFGKIKRLIGMSQKFSKGDAILWES
jgi:hypothetical protein